MCTRACKKVEVKVKVKEMPESETRKYSGMRAIDLENLVKEKKVKEKKSVNIQRVVQLNRTFSKAIRQKFR